MAASDPVADPGDALTDARVLVEDLATPAGEFVVVGKETGVRPDPVTGFAFDDYEAAERARDAAARYRRALREHDPALPEYDLVVGETDSNPIEVATVRESTRERRTNGVPRARQTVTLTGDRRDEWLRVENAPLVHLTGPDELLDDELVTRQLQSKL
ncbi:hypothetical protein G9C85_15600 [Halorubellus sp. JP-L1]|uniref:DUF7552 domain-containing protein n=1 Tax=Halorubellus sp. JP-L1 TaxID=2715753 RepID=UPI00140BC70E|nr:hypothetical protein [Halorubellus sp. JP-L1]NHN43043.1 hypothetical protein [Halorubellus sp. JP-L1]